MKVTEVKINKIQNPKGKVLAFASVTFDDVLTLNDCKVVDGKDGLFVGLPTRAYEVDGETNYSATVFINDDYLYDAVQDAVLDEYEKSATKRKGGRCK